MIECAVTIEHWDMHEVFATSRDAITAIPVILVTLTDTEGHVGRGEAAGVDYDGETPESMAAQVRSVAHHLTDSLSVAELQRLLPHGGARNALDCALWDLRAKQSGIPVAVTSGLPALHPVRTVLTLGLADETDTRRKAREARGYPELKLKLDAERHLDVVRMVREEHPSARLVVDANQAWDRSLLDRLEPAMRDLGVELIEQPVRRGEDASLDGYAGRIPLAADESCVDRGSFAALLGRYQYINIKLDKCGGLTEALAMVAEARRVGFGLMVGNMCGTSLAMAPGFLIAQSCTHVDLDGPLLQRLDRASPIRFDQGLMSVPERSLWG
jgi:L-alanine-DL-glutamate epimerase-like enolase superfamily enzyme